MFLCFFVPSLALSFVPSFLCSFVPLFLRWLLASFAHTLAHALVRFWFYHVRKLLLKLGFWPWPKGFEGYGSGVGKEVKAGEEGDGEGGEEAAAAATTKKKERRRKSTRRATPKADKVNGEEEEEEEREEVEATTRHRYSLRKRR